uniref:hypothetical protein n=1 Tax=uncultured Acidovorax sp. TaxID=158751 RepID=UPI000A526A02|nr:hypothetical protein [uncultured Acidovorax sp.]
MEILEIFGERVSFRVGEKGRIGANKLDVLTGPNRLLGSVRISVCEAVESVTQS